MANRLINPITGTPVISYNEAALFFMATRIHYRPPPLDELVDEWMFKLDVEKAVMEQEKAKQEAAEA
ncbi:hypothetical protein HBI52_217870 [Parastagonospora nodorum]|nr:hypothetical protein HBI52_217870 [Parastagonospora nodorum]